MQTTLLDSPESIEARVRALQNPAMASLNRYVEEMRERRGQVPWFDPFDGGSEARLLLLLETPGPRMSEPRFVSRDNPTPTGKNLRKFLTIPRDLTAIWNAVPWVIHQPGEKNRAPKAGEIREGARELEGLLALFPRLEVVLVCGHIARKAVPVLENRSLTVLTMPHPSPTFVNTSPLVAEAIRHSVKLASTALGFS